jgi:hypothetical protein
LARGASAPFFIGWHLIAVLQTPFPLIVVIAAVIDAIGGRVMPDKFKIGAGHADGGKTSFSPDDHQWRSPLAWRPV